MSVVGYAVLCNEAGAGVKRCANYKAASLLPSKPLLTVPNCVQPVVQPRNRACCAICSRATEHTAIFSVGEQPSLAQYDLRPVCSSCE